MNQNIQGNSHPSLTLDFFPLYLTSMNKEEIRKRVWKYMEENDLVNFPRPCYHRIPNFKGARKAALRILRIPEFKKAECVFSAPDACLREVRKLTLLNRKTLAVALPHKRGYLELKGNLPEDSVNIKGFKKYGRPFSTVVDLFVQGSVAVDRKGNRLGKGRGYGDEEYREIKKMGLLSSKVEVITLVHDCQITDDFSALMTDSDVKVDYILTPLKTVKCKKDEFIVAIDGTAASGKTTTARLTAERIGFLWMDTGAMYRAITLKMIELESLRAEELTPWNRRHSTGLKRILNNTKIKLNSGKVFLDGRDVTEEIRSEEVNRLVSKISDISEVREVMVKQQRELAKGKRIICEGRDIGSVVFPKADLKIFMDADIKERTKRRKKEFLTLRSGTKEGRGDILLSQVEEELRRRDEYDSKRTHSPLRKIEDAILLDTTPLSIEEEVDFLIREIQERL